MRKSDKEKVLAFIDELADYLEEHDVVDAKEMVDHNESMIAIENICSQLYEYGGVISSELYDKILHITSEWGIDEKYRRCLNELVDS